MPRFGSSPLTRGKRSSYRTRPLWSGLIPAHAGKTAERSAATPINSGSSPLTRGKQARCLPPLRLVGLIPAHAGKTPIYPVPNAVRGAHPRVGGENDRDVATAVSFTGSSPRGRGKRQQDGDREAAARLIPAWAGKTQDRRGCSCCGRAHPRVGGENILTTGDYDGNLGSSPRGRGKPRV